MIINTSTRKKIRRKKRFQSPAIMTKKDGSIWKITGNRKKKITLIKGPKAIICAK